ncbi:MAG: AP endonuclease, partial [Mesorhizobium sp.]
MTAGVAFLAMTALTAALLAGFLGALHPALDSFSHFRIHLSVLTALLAVA